MFESVKSVDFYGDSVFLSKESNSIKGEYISLEPTNFAVIDGKNYVYGKATYRSGSTVAYSDFIAFGTSLNNVEIYFKKFTIEGVSNFIGRKKGYRVSLDKDDSHNFRENFITFMNSGDVKGRGISEYSFSSVETDQDRSQKVDGDDKSPQDSEEKISFEKKEFSDSKAAIDPDIFSIENPNNFSIDFFAYNKKSRFKDNEYLVEIASVPNFGSSGKRMTLSNDKGEFSIDFKKHTGFVGGQSVPDPFGGASKSVLEIYRGEYTEGFSISQDKNAPLKETFSEWCGLVGNEFKAAVNITHGQLLECDQGYARDVLLSVEYIIFVPTHKERKDYMEIRIAGEGEISFGENNCLTKEQYNNMISIFPNIQNEISGIIIDQ